MTARPKTHFAHRHGVLCSKHQEILRVTHRAPVTDCEGCLRKLVDHGREAERRLERLGYALHGSDCAPPADDHEPGAVPYKGGPMVGCPAAPGSPSNDEPCATCGDTMEVPDADSLCGSVPCPSCAVEADDA